MEIAVLFWQILGGLILIVGFLVAICIATFMGITICAFLYPYTSKMFGKWLTWVKARFDWNEL